LPDAAKVRNSLESKLRECMHEGVKIDSITFAGDGEPTLNTQFPQIVDDTLTLRDMYYPSAKVSVLSNATRLRSPGVFEALCKVDNPIMKVDAPTTELASRINRAFKGYEIRDVVDDLKAFGGDFILQTMFLKSADFDSSAPECLEGWMNIVRELSPREIMVYSIDRPTPQQGLQKFTEAQMRELVKPLLNEGFRIQIKG